MDRDRARASFEEFTAARWPGLVRVAYLLTGHQQDAEDLVQSALERVALRFYEDLSESQTADVLGCSAGTVKSQTRHALSRLRILNPHLLEEAVRR